jgi:hypothetical protein
MTPVARVGHDQGLRVTGRGDCPEVVDDRQLGLGPERFAHEHEVWHPAVDVDHRRVGGSDEDKLRACVAADDPAERLCLFSVRVDSEY